MSFDDHETGTDHAERFLRAARCEPTEEFITRTERRLFGRKARRTRRPMFAALGLTGAVAGFALAAGLLGAGPLALNGQEDVRARDDCRTMEVTTIQREGELTRTPDGTTTVVSEDRPVSRWVERCR